MCVFIVHIRNPRPSMIILFPIIAGSHRIFLNDFFPVPKFLLKTLRHQSFSRLICINSIGTLRLMMQSQNVQIADPPVDGVSLSLARAFAPVE